MILKKSKPADPKDLNRDLQTHHFEVYDGAVLEVNEVPARDERRSIQRGSMSNDPNHVMDVRRHAIEGEDLGLQSRQPINGGNADRTVGAKVAHDWTK